MCYIFGLKWEELDNITQEESLYKVHSPGKDYGEWKKFKGISINRYTVY